MKKISKLLIVTTALIGSTFAQAQNSAPAVEKLTTEDAIVCAAYRYQLSQVLENSNPEMSEQMSAKTNRWMAHIQKELKVDRDGSLREMGSSVYAFEKMFQKLSAGDKEAEKQLSQAGPFCGMLEYDHKGILDVASGSGSE